MEFARSGMDVAVALAEFRRLDYVAEHGILAATYLQESGVLAVLAAHTEAGQEAGATVTSPSCSGRIVAEPAMTGGHDGKMA